MARKHIVDRLSKDRKLSPEEIQKRKEISKALKSNDCELNALDKREDRNAAKVARARKQMEARLRVMEKSLAATVTKMSRKLLLKMENLQSQCPHTYKVDGYASDGERYKCTNCRNYKWKMFLHEHRRPPRNA